VRVKSGPGFPFTQPAGGPRGAINGAGGLVTQQWAVRGSKLTKLPRQVLGRGLGGTKVARLRRSSSADLPKRVLIKSGLWAISSAASGLKSSLAACLAPHLERLKMQDACYQQALERGADEETLSRLEEEMTSTASTIQGITDELTKMYDRLVDTVFLIYSGLTGGEFVDVVAARLARLHPRLAEKHRLLDFSSTGLGLDNLGFRYADVKGKLDRAFDILTAYEELTVEKRTGYGQPVRSIGFQRVSGIGQFGAAKMPWRVNTLV
jgi:hypothetical protein